LHIYPRISGTLGQNIHYIKSENKAGRQWLMPVILATQEAQNRRIAVQSQSWQIVQEILS
jgi:hypothetical protein